MEATTMTAIAERSGSSIGALYNYFPDKQAIALTLLDQYAQEMEEQWRPLIEQAENLTHREFASLFIERITEIVQLRPAYLKLLAAPIRLRRDPAAKRVLRANIAKAFRAKNPSLSDEQAVLAANVTLEKRTRILDTQRTTTTRPRLTGYSTRSCARDLASSTRSR
jgi:AcrR family transcriptional regulator